MHISLRHILASLSVAALTSSVVEAIPTKIQRYSESSLLAKRATARESLTRADFQNYASSAINALQKTYWNAPSGLWGSYDKSGKFSPQWWPSANVLTMMANYYGKYPTTATWMPDVFATILTHAPAYAKGFLNDYYDDELWWVLAWIQVYDATGNVTYLNTAAEIYEDSKSVYGNTPCGGLWWDKNHAGVNSVENELYLTASAKLANRLPAKKNSQGQGYYYSQALIAYDFLITNTTTSMNPSTHLFNDGISMTTCKNNGKIVFTYNQGIILSGLTELTWSTRSHSYTALAVQIANSVIANMTTSEGILQEKACEPNACNGDEQQFKGVFTRNLSFMVNRATGMDADVLAKYRAFLALNAESIIRKDTSSDNMLGLVWSGATKPVYSVQTDGSALDTLVGAAITALN
ncbi:uncharacterized protein EAF02_005763 [Botrytis sinoallii]|uniref:uncharacterized protein n=1 Tax=Botrytis sinoallii TaxID=1463999 RepID=UPI001900DDD8|nr:uncharacterized protein EAF02_005763 [Botrytis sinoallii]KAF7882400.1 hypothetical protein EAF02_005763 [Botrytis sinoallii]